MMPCRTLAEKVHVGATKRSLTLFDPGACGGLPGTDRCRRGQGRGPAPGSWEHRAVACVAARAISEQVKTFVPARASRKRRRSDPRPGRRGCIRSVLPGLSSAGIVPSSAQAPMP